MHVDVWMCWKVKINVKLWYRLWLRINANIGKSTTHTVTAKFVQCRGILAWQIIISISTAVDVIVYLGKIINGSALFHSARA